MAFRLAFTNPEWFAGVASFGGSLPANLTPLSNWLQCRDLPVFWAQGRHSTRFPESNLCRQLRLLHIAGFDVTLRQYPAGNETSANAYDDFNRWIALDLGYIDQWSLWLDFKILLKTIPAVLSTRGAA